MLSVLDKKKIVDSVRDKLSAFSEIKKVIFFGSFIDSDEPNDLDIAVIQKSDESYISLSLKYRKVLRDISKKIPIDIVPIKEDGRGFFIGEIEKGKVIYER